MPRYGVNITVQDLYFEIEAEDEQDAMDQAFDAAVEVLNDRGHGIDLDCNEVVELD